MKSKEQIAEVIVAFETYRQLIRKNKEAQEQQFVDETDQIMAKTNEVLLWVLEHPMGVESFERICQISIGRTKELIGEESLNKAAQTILEKVEDK